MADTERLTITVLAFARMRELLGSGRFEIEATHRENGDAFSALDAWRMLAADRPELARHFDSTRFARNGRLIDPDDALEDGDELALLPPTGGG